MTQAEKAPPGIQAQFENPVDYEMTQANLTLYIHLTMFENPVDYEMTQAYSLEGQQVLSFENPVDYEMTQAFRISHQSYFPYHSLDPEQAIERIMEAKGMDEKNEIARVVEIMRRVRKKHSAE